MSSRAGEGSAFVCFQQETADASLRSMTAALFMSLLTKVLHQHYMTIHPVHLRVQHPLTIRRYRQRPVTIDELFVYCADSSHPLRIEVVEVNGGMWLRVEIDETDPLLSQVPKPFRLSVKHQGSVSALDRHPPD